MIIYPKTYKYEKLLYANAFVNFMIMIGISALSEHKWLGLFFIVAMMFSIVRAMSISTDRLDEGLRL